MHVIISLDEADARQWLLPLSEALAGAGHAISFRLRPSSRGRDHGIDTLLRLEARLFGLDCKLMAPLPADTLPVASPDAAPGVILDISGDPSVGDLTLFLDGAPGIQSASASLVSGHIPFVEFRDKAGKTIASGLPAIESPDVVTRAIGQFFCRLTTLVLMALDGKARDPVRPPQTDRTPVPQSPYAFFARSVVNKIANRLFSARRRRDHWRIGIRPVRGALDLDRDTLIEGFTWLPDDGARYYADPILWNEEGRDFLFLEEFPYATHRGIISYTELDTGGRPLFVPRPIIERTTHLSYPLIFRHAGALYMMPENSAENHVPLYRAKRFPDEWEEVAPLLAGHGLHDATLVEHGGLWWLFGNDAREGGSSWDCLTLFSGSTPLGPFTPHPANPVLVDARVSRPGGPMLRIGNRLIRPVQSCLGGYGRFTRFIEVEALSMETYRQRECGRMLAPLGGQISGIHTYCRNERFEAIDALTPRIFRG